MSFYLLTAQTDCNTQMSFFLPFSKTLPHQSWLREEADLSLRANACRGTTSFDIWVCVLHWIRSFKANETDLMFSSQRVRFCSLDQACLCVIKCVVYMNVCIYTEMNSLNSTTVFVVFLVQTLVSYSQITHNTVYVLNHI